MNRLYRGTIVIGIETDCHRSQYEVLADNGIMLLLLFREHSGVEEPTKTKLSIRPKDMFKVKENPTAHSSDDINLFLPENWYVRHEDIRIYHKNNTGSVLSILFF